VDGLLEIMTKHNIQFEDIQRVECGVYQAAIDVLGDGVETVHQSKFSMGFVIAVAAKYGRAGITDFTEAKLKEKDLLEFMTKVEMILDDEINAAFPKEWMAVVRVTTKGGRKYETKMETPKGDPNNTLTKYGSIVSFSELMCREEIDSKARGLFRYGGWTDAKAQDELINKLWEIEKEMKVTL
jgi:aconitate decarboxylase